jgi:BirA family biotin operon repressor/biotin-[acetyl-CoA-carboxylase] ligase
MLGDRIIKFKTIDSTHKFAIRLIESGGVSECSIIAENQTNAVGKLERPWISIKGNLFASIIKKVTENIDPGQLSMCVACAVRESLVEYIGDNGNLRLHWPNDIYFNESKISGILLALLEDWLVISFSINIVPVPFEKAISIKEISNLDGIDPQQMLECTLKNINQWFRNFSESGFSRIKDYWLQYINKINCKIIIRNGSGSLSGVFTGIDDSGMLILDADGRRLFVSSGDVFTDLENGKVSYG